MKRPYIVSEDIYLLLRHWAEKKSFVLPEEVFFQSLRSDFSTFFKGIFSNFEMISEQEMVVGIEAFVGESGLIPISLDRAYYLSKYSFEITRFVDVNNSDAGTRERHGTPRVHVQLQRLREELTGKEVVLVDDVIFSGDAIEIVVKKLSQLGIKVVAVCAGIGIEKGVSRLNSAGYKVNCVRVYESVVDEVCERDFYPGVPLSGRSVVGKKNIGAPYILPFGSPGEWASIPQEWQGPLSEFCINQTIRLFEAIERRSKRFVRCNDIDRKVVSLPVNSKERYVDCLKRVLIKIQKTDYIK